MGTQVRWRLRRHLFTGHRFAATGLHRTYVSLLERGLRAPSIIVVRQLARGLGTTMTSLIRALEAEAG